MPEFVVWEVRKQKSKTGRKKTRTDVIPNKEDDLPLSDVCKALSLVASAVLNGSKI